MIQASYLQSIQHYCAKILHIRDLNLLGDGNTKRLHIGDLNLLGDGTLRDYTLGIWVLNQFYLLQIFDLVNP